MKAKQWPTKPEKCYDDGEDAMPRVWGLLVSSEQSQDHVTVGLRFVTVRGGTPGRLRNAGHRHPMDDLVVYAQGDRKRPGELYGYGVRYERVFAVERDDASRMYWTLAKVESGMRRLSDKYGREESWTSWVRRVMDVCKVTWLVQRTAETRSSSYDDGTYVYHSGSEVQYQLQQIQRELWTKGEWEKQERVEA